MSDAYEREQYHPPFPSTLLHPKATSTNSPNSQTTSRRTELSSKVSALRGVTVDIYDNARNQDVIDNSVWPPTFLFPPTNSLISHLAYLVNILLKS